MKNAYQENCRLVKKGMEVCCQFLEDPKRTPESGPFEAYRIFFGFRGSKNEAMFRVEHQSGDWRWLRFIVARPGCDMAVSHYIKKGTNAELIEYLSDESRVVEFVADFQHLSDSVDDKVD